MPKTRAAALAQLAVEVSKVVDKDVRDPMAASHLKNKVMVLVEEMLDDAGHALFVKE